ncbi:MAG TPA: chorismate mutase [Bryobacteraceae bacterium]|nr:chorismate mutase [Bryobacteraceae bacterium]
MTREEAFTALSEFRDKIDDIDRGILQLLNERTSIVECIGAIKREQAMPVYEPRREDEVYRNVTLHNRGPLPPDAVKRIFERIIDEMRTLQKQRMQS